MSPEVTRTSKRQRQFRRILPMSSPATESSEAARSAFKDSRDELPIWRCAAAIISERRKSGLGMERYSAEIRRYPQRLGRIRHYVLIMDDAHDIRKSRLQAIHHFIVPEDMVTSGLEVITVVIRDTIPAHIHSQDQVIHIPLDEQQANLRKSTDHKIHIVDPNRMGVGKHPR